MEATLSGETSTDATEVTLVTCNVCGDVTGPPAAFRDFKLKMFRAGDGVLMKGFLLPILCCVACLEHYGEPTAAYHQINEDPDWATFEKTGDTRRKLAF